MSQAEAVPAPASALAVEITGMHKWYGEFHVLRDINLAVERRERIVICGPSGSGKSTMIRCINRLEEHQQGRIIVRSEEHTSELQSQSNLVCRLLLEKKKKSESDSSAPQYVACGYVV